MDVRVPALGESVDEVRVTAWLHRPGDHVDEGQSLLEVETDKVNTEVPAPASGVLTEILVPDGATAGIGALLARITPVGVGPADAAHHERPTRDPQLRSPLTRRLAREHGLVPATVVGTGVGGRVTAADLRASLRARESPAVAATVSAVSTPAAGPSTTSAPSGEATSPAGARPPADADFEPFNPVRRRTAERMLLSATTIPQVTTIVEVNYERVSQARRSAAPMLRERDGIALTYLPFITYATAQSLKRFPHLNATVDGRGLWVHRNVHIGVAVDLDHQGLIVPVVRDAADLGLVGLARRIHDLAAAARARRLGLADLRDGTFTITNPGGYGTFAGTPLINPPQVAILNVDGVSRQAVVTTNAAGVEGFAIQHVGRLCLAWDHRAVDGAYAAAFLADVRDRLQTTDWSALL